MVRVFSIPGVMHIDIKSPVWDLISGMRQLEEKLWKVFSDKRNGTVNRLKLDECAAMSWSLLDGCVRLPVKGVCTFGGGHSHVNRGELSRYGVSEDALLKL